MNSAAYARRQSAIREPEPQQHHDPNEEKNWGSPSYLERLLELDEVIQHTPIDEREKSPACQQAYATLKAMHRPKFHVCTRCGMEYGNDQTVIKEDLSNLRGICPWCKGKTVADKQKAEDARELGFL